MERACDGPQSFAAGDARGVSVLSAMKKLHVSNCAVTMGGFTLPGSGYLPAGVLVSLLSFN
jgi:hypothetical protein